MPNLHPFLNGRYRAYCDVEECWTDYVVKYTRKLNRHHGQKNSGVHFLVKLEPTTIPEQLLQFSVKFETIFFCENNYVKTWDEPLPESLEVWLLKHTDTFDVRLNFVLSPSQLDALSDIPEFACKVKDEGGLYLLNKVLNNRPPALKFWFLHVEPDATRCLEKLMTAFGVLPEVEPFEYYSQQVLMDIRRYAGVPGFFLSIRSLE